MGGSEEVLLVDDEPDLRRLVAFHLADAGFRTYEADTGEAALALADKHRPHIALLDLMLPDISGTEVCRKLRENKGTSEMGILMLTARGDEYDRVLGFEVGADDYVVKPFSVRELVLRVRALARRTRERMLAREKPDAETPPLCFRDLRIDAVRHRVYLREAEVSLRPLEYKLLVTLVEAPGRVFSRTELLEEVWGITADVQTRTVDTHVRRLREKIQPYGDAIETVHGFGYRLCDV